MILLLFYRKQMPDSLYGKPAFTNFPLSKTHANNMKPLPFFVCLFAIVLFSCKGKDKNTGPVKDTLQIKRAEPKPSDIKVTRPPIINIIDTVSPKRIVLVMKDSAANTARISLKLAQIYGVKLADVIKKNNLKVTGAPMAWYRSQKAPFFFEAGVPVNKRPAKLPAGVKVKEMGVDSVVMAHFYGPYELTPQGYDAIKERLKDIKKSAKGAPYEIYVSDPVEKNGKPIDPYKLQTDIVFPRN
jgi:effector-binding domain-containing protein